MIGKRILAEQRGAISIMAGLSLVFIVASAAMTVDIGQAAWKKRDLQKMVDVVSLDAVRAVGDRRATDVDACTKALEFAQEAADRNDFDYDDTAAGNSITIELGTAVQATKEFTSYGVVGSASPPTTAQCAAANAVRVTATHRSDNRFMPGNVPLTTQAIAMTDGEATFSVGSRLASFDSSDSALLNGVLGDMLSSAVSLDAVSYNGLAAASVTLDDVWANLGLGSSSQIASSEVLIDDLITATADALNDQGDPTSVAAASILGTLAVQVTSSVHFKWGDLIEAASGDPGDAANAKMNVLEMIGMAATVANGTNLIDLTIPITIPGVASGTFKMGVIEPPQVRRGPVGTKAETAQARMQLDLTLTQKLNVGLISNGTVKLPLYLEAAGAEGVLEAIRCAEPESASDITVETTTKALTARIGSATTGSLTDGSIPADITDGEIVNMAGLVRVTGSATATMPLSVTDLLIPLLEYRSAGSSTGVTVDDQLLSNLSLSVQVLGFLGLGITSTTVANNVLAILTPVLSTLDSTLFTPIKDALGALGIELGGADVGNLAQECDMRRLIG